MLFSFLRVITIGTVLLFRKTLPYTNYQYFFYAFVISHYCLSIVYSRRRILQIFSGGLSQLKIMALSMIGLFMYSINFPGSEVYLGLHHAVSETFTPVSSGSIPSRSTTSWMILSRFVLNTAIALYILSNSDLISNAYSMLYFRLILISAIAYVLLFIFNFKSLQGSIGSNDLLFFELLGALPFLIFKKCPATYNDLGLYHVIFWLYFPIISKGKKHISQALIYGTVSLSMVFILYLCTPPERILADFSAAKWLAWVKALSYLHFTASFAISEANPGFVMRWFRPKNKVLI